MLSGSSSASSSNWEKSTLIKRRAAGFGGRAPSLGEESTNLLREVLEKTKYLYELNTKKKHFEFFGRINI